MAAAGAVPPQYVQMHFNLNYGSYDHFIRNFRYVLAHHNSPEHVWGHNVLAMQLVPAGPRRWMHINLVGNRTDGQDATATLAVRDDNVYLCGFRARNGRWYELARGRNNSVMRQLNPIFCGCDVAYGELLNVGCTSFGARGAMMHLQLGREAALGAVDILSRYNQQVGGVIDTVTSTELVRLILMFCEATRMDQFFNAIRSNWGNGTTLQRSRLIHIWEWANMSGALLQWRDTQPSYTWWGRCTLTVSLSQLTRQHKYRDVRAGAGVDIMSARQAHRKVQLLLNTARRGTNIKHLQHSKGKEKEQDGDGNVPPESSGSKRNQRKKRFARVIGRPLVQVFSVRADPGVVVGTVAVFDGKRGQIIYTHCSSIHDSVLQQSQGMLDLALTGPYRAISADGSFAIQVDWNDASDESKNVRGDMLWNCYSNDAVYDKALTQVITKDDRSIKDITKDGRYIVEVTYAVLSDAVEATVQVHLKLEGQYIAGATARVYGEITAKNQRFPNNTMLLFGRTDEDGMELQVDPSAEQGLGVIQLPLARSVVATPLDSLLQLEVKVYAAYPPNHEKFYFHEYMDFPPLDQHTGEMERNGVVVQVTSPHVYAPPEQGEKTLPASLAPSIVPVLTAADRQRRPVTGTTSSHGFDIRPRRPSPRL
ncbi:unnamed protein product [Alopecurus aequalis]